MSLTSARFAADPGMVRASQNNPPLKVGAPKSEAVRILQMALIDLGFSMPRSTKQGASLPDGIFGQETQAVVMSFQRGEGLVQDGVAGAKTLARLDQIIIVASNATADADRLGGRKGTGRG